MLTEIPYTPPAKHNTRFARYYCLRLLHSLLLTQLSILYQSKGNVVIFKPAVSCFLNDLGKHTIVHDTDNFL